MVHWSEAAVTDVGNEMLNEMMAGRILTVTAAYGGTGFVDAEQLASQTGLKEQKQKLSVTDEETDSNGKVVTVQITNATEEYELNQVGVFAKLDMARNSDAEEKMLFIMQDRNGIIVPTIDDPTFVLELFCALKIVNNGRFEITIDKSGIVNISYLEKKLAAHDEDREAHQDIRDKLDVLKTQTSLEVGTVEFSNTQAYPFPAEAKTVNLEVQRECLDYTVQTEVLETTGNVQDVEVFDKQLNGFKICIDGSASKATVKYYVSGGMTK